MEQSIVEGLGRKEAKLIASLREDGKRVFRTADANKILDSSTNAVNILLSKLVKKKKILRIERGKYLIIPPEAWKTGEYLEEGIILASTLIEPYYLSYWTALNYYGYTEQPANTIFVVAQKSRIALNIGQMRFQFIKLNPSKFFGFETVWIGNQKVNMATREKTIVDGLDQSRYCGEITEVVKGIWNGRKELDWKKLADYSLRMNNSAILKRLGFLIEILGIHKPAQIKRLRKNIGKGYSPLDPNGSKTGKYNNRWNLRVNVPEKNLLEWRKH
jgi:predicted transcriptional regulator of viral defense system